MHYLVSVIADGTELATPGEMAARSRRCCPQVNVR